MIYEAIKKAKAEIDSAFAFFIYRYCIGNYSVPILS